MRVILAICFLWTSLSCGEEREKNANAAIVEGARARIGVTTRYVPDYVALSYPGGDVPEETGVCTDVVIRALRATGVDLQKLVHEDMAAHFSAYPRNWGLKRPDRNIDHRRVPNLQTYFERQGLALPVTQEPGDYLPGDLVTCLVNGRLPHIMVVSDKKSLRGIPLVIHNIGAGTREENRLFAFPLTGHYRFYQKEQELSSPSSQSGS
ncbi:DUF1287 domain-containing protein [Roseibacillus ishigakijimensis]|uniref:DUF1287 domain-containing protein n=1 Tax=Roseibacillus ishigakijimensis TaxID=454146 RepID=A0A934RNL0_9BACT|nr:DUF1287 domain-containing protein [Roseibacillus ishigakijimensis]